jgi:FAD/FMN-containing dehydrogenase
LDRLSASLRGGLLTRESPLYDETRAVWNGMIDRRPSIIAQCLGTSDVLASIRFAREHELPVCIRSGGHVAGLGVADDALMIDLSRMRGIFVDTERRRTLAQAGCLLQDVDRETQLHGLAAVLGFVSTTGIAGLTLGGGFGYLTRKHGWTSDTVRSMEVVTADGRIVRTSEDENPDLFWGLRGGGGNFGIVTRFEYDLFPVGPVIMGGGIAWPGDDAAAVLELYAELVATAPPECTLVGALRKAPPAPWIDPA